MEAAVVLGSSAMSMATPPLGPSKVPNLGAIGKRRLGLESLMKGRILAIPQRRRGVMRMCMGEMQVAGGAANKVTEIKAESELSKAPPAFPLLDLYQFICR